MRDTFDKEAKPIKHTCCVASNVSKSPSGSLFHRGIKLFQANDEGFQGASIHNSLGKFRRMLGDSAKHKGSSLLVKPLQADEASSTLM